MKTVYLAGPMSGLTWKEMSEWRCEAAEKLQVHGLQTITPTRAKPFLKDPALIRRRWIRDVAVSRRDRNDLKNASAVLMNLSMTEAISIGTMVELGWADAFGVPVILVVQPGAVQHVFLRALATEIVYSLEEGITAILELLNC